MIAARATGIRKSYGSRAVLTGVDLEVPAGGVTALLGPSGCGKTTLLRALAGFDRLDAGTVELAGELVDGPGAFVPARCRRIGYVPQEGALFTHLSVAANIGFGVPRRERRERVTRLLGLIGLADLKDRRPDQLSGGQQQRVALARALAVDPHLVLLDEPFSALDPGLREQVRTDVLGLLRRTGTTALLVTHDQEEALSVADQVAVLDGGRIAQVATPQELYARPTTVEVARFLGAGTLLPATRSARGVDCAFGRLEVLPTAATGRGQVLVRSEQVHLTDGAQAEVVARAFYGHDAVVTLALGATRVQSRCLGSVVPEVGALVGVEVLGPVVFLPGE